METLLALVVNAAAFFVGAQLLSGVQLKGFVQALVVAVLVALLNITLGTVLKIVTLGILSLGIFTLLLDAILILIADYFLKNFSVRNFWWALALAAIVALLDALFGRLI